MVNSATKMKAATAFLLFALCCPGAHRQASIAAGSAVYVDSNNGFDLFLIAALQAKHVPLRVVSSREKADYTLDSAVFHTSEFVATNSVARTGRTSEAAVKLTSKSGDVIWAYAVTKGILSRGKQSIAEACVKHIKDLIVYAK